jgi:hypothetical protein
MRIKHNWSEILETWKSSGKSKQQFCKESGLVYPTFLYNLKKLEGVAPDSGRFQQVILEGASGMDRIEYHHSDGRCISFPVSAPKELIRFLVSL